MFHLTTGPFAQLETAFLSDVLAARRQDPLSSLLVLSPSGHLLTRLQRELSRRESGLIHIHFLTFYGLAERLSADAGYHETIVTEPAFYSEMVRDVLSGPEPEEIDLQIRAALGLENNRVPHGLPAALAATLKDLRDSGLRADHALEAAREGFLGAEAPEAAPTLMLYSRLVRLFEKRGLRSSADLLRRAAEQTPRHPWVRSQKSVFLYGFYDLTGVQLDFALSFARHADARIYFPYEKENSAFDYAGKLLNDPALSSQTYPAATPGRPARPPAIDITSVSGVRDELWSIAKEILKLHDDKTDWEEIAVVARNLAAYLPALGEILDAHAIPYVCSRGAPAGSHPLVKAVHALLAADEHHPSSRILRQDLEKSAYFQAASQSPAPDASEAPVPWSDHVRWATEKIRKQIRLPAQASPEEAALLEALVESLEALQTLDALARPVARSHFLKTWETKVRSLERPAAGGTHLGVQILDVQQARGLSFRAVFLLGMNEKVFPRLIREDPFLSDAARAALAQATGCRLSRKLSGYEEERLLFALMRQAARERLSLVTQRSDEEGKTLVPSIYLQEVQKEIPGLQAARIPRAAAQKFRHRAPLTWTPKEMSFLINRARLDPKLFYGALHWNLPEFYRLLAAHRAVESFTPGLGAHDARISDPGPIQIAVEKGFSPSSLEEIAQCPFQYYASHLLRISPKEELAPNGELTDRALGKLFHRTLELFYRACRDRGAFPTRDSELTQSLLLALSACFEERAESLSAVYPLALKACKALIYKYLFSFIKNDIEECRSTGFQPMWFEQSLEGPITQLPGYLFHGQPDRMDVRRGPGNAQVRIVDYKSGKPKPFNGRIETAFLKGQFLQLPVYLALAAPFVEKMLGIRAAAEEAALRSIRPSEDEDAKKNISTAFWESPSAAMFFENIKELIGIIEKGRFYLEPNTGSWGYCGRCDFVRICRKEHMPTRRRSERDPLRIRIKELFSRTAPKEGGPKRSQKEILG